MQKQFACEIELIKGKHCNKNNHSSIIHFSVNKAATQYIRDILGRCATMIGMTHVRLAEYAFHTDFPYLDNLSVVEMQKYQYLFRPTGYLYSVFGGMIEGIIDFDKYSTVLVIRDPRDILVSEYYSRGYSHAVPSNRGNKYNDFMKTRRQARQFTVDEYVISESDKVYDTYQRYIKLLINRYPQIYVSKYEDMTSDYQGWLKKLLTYCKLDITNEYVQHLSKEATQLLPKKEDIHQHIRKGMPGDHKEKLKQQTIEFLGSKFSSVLKEFNYV
jgi:hypothetical protein